MPVFTKLNRQKSFSTMSLYNNNNNRELLNKYRICLKYVPDDVTSKDIEKLCSQYGKILNVTYSEKTPFKFVSFSSKSEMDRALEGLKDNQYGFHAYLAKNSSDNDETASVTKSLLDSIIDDDEVDEGRNSFKQKRFNRSASLTRDRNQNKHHQHRFSRNKNHEKGNQNSPSKENGHYKDVKIPQKNLKQSIHKNDTSPKTAAIEEENLNRSDINKKVNNDNSGTKISSSPNKEENDAIPDYIDGDVVGKCVLCMKLGKNACSRCGDCYCSFECQIDNWPQHRYFCIAMPNLIPLSKSKISLYNNFRPSVQQPQQSGTSDGGNMNHVLQMTQAPKQMPQVEHNNLNVESGSYNARNSGVQQRSASPQPSSSKYNNNTTHDSRVAHIKKVPTATKSIVSTDENKNNNDKLSTVTSEKPIVEGVSISKDKLTVEKHDSKSTNYDDIKPIEQNNDSTKSDNNEKYQNTNFDAYFDTLLSEFPASGNYIQIMSVLLPKIVYIRSLDNESNLQYIKCINNVNNESRNANNLTVLPKKFDLVAAKSQGNTYCRAAVFEVKNQNEINVLIIDYGVYEQKSLKDLKQLSDNAKKFKRYLLPVKFENFKNLKNHTDKIKTYEHEIQDYLESYVESFSKQIKIVYDSNDMKDNNSYEVELIDETNNESLNKRLLDILQKK